MAIWRQILILVVLAAAGFGGFVGYQSFVGANRATADGPGRGGRIVTVEVEPARFEALERKVEAVGTTRARQSIQIKPLASGTIVELAIVPGARVAAGDVLARLDDEIQISDLSEAEAVVVESRQAAERARSLLKSRAVAESMAEQAVSRLAVAEAIHNRARRRLDDRTIRAPFSGQVGLSEVDLGARVDESTMLTRLDDLSEVEVEFSLPEALFAEIRLGMPVAAVAAAFPGRAFGGEVFAVDSRIDPVSRAFRVRAAIPNPAGELPAGMFMSLSLTLSTTRELVAPEEAIVAQAGATYVFVVADGKVERRQVETGMRTGGVVAVKDGLAEGELVATRGLASVRDGAAVNVLGGEPEPDLEPKS